MTSNKTDKVETPKKIKFPCLRAFPDGTLIVLFNYYYKGTVVYSEREDYKIGKYFESWSSADGSDWVDYDGAITLQN
jgi:hypothetical protein